jgi:hypothetical protein
MLCFWLLAPGFWLLALRIPTVICLFILKNDPFPP